jgi:AcrR family transcriptional regulator
MGIRRNVTPKENVEKYEATRQLIVSGTLEPTAKDIADKANVTTRTLFRHFPDLESLHRCLIDEAEASVARVMDEPFLMVDWQDGLNVLIDRRVRVYESILPLYMSNIWNKYRAHTDRNGRKGVKRRRQRLKAVLPELDELMFEALDGILSIEYWTSLRRDQRLSAAKAECTVRLAVQQLTAGMQPGDR